MKRASIAELKAKLSEYVAAARRGEDVIVTDRGKPVVRITALGEISDDERIADLVRRGVLRPAKRKLPRDFLSRELPGDGSTSLLKTLLEQRDEGW